MDIQQARQIVATIPETHRTILSDAHDRYMYFTGVYTDRPAVDHIAEDRSVFPHLLAFTDDGRPSLSDERCAEFMAAITGLPRDLCLAWDENEFIETHGENIYAKQNRKKLIAE